LLQGQTQMYTRTSAGQRVHQAPNASGDRNVPGAYRDICPQRIAVPIARRAPLTTWHHFAAYTDISRAGRWKSRFRNANPACYT